MSVAVTMHTHVVKTKCFNWKLHYFVKPLSYFCFLILTINFIFKHHMMVINAKACYIYKMSAMESQDVHTTHGLHVLEVSTTHMAYIYWR